MGTPTAAIPDVLVMQRPVFRDDRGYFSETWSAARHGRLGVPTAFVQDNLSRSSRGVLRGLHFQWPNAQGKLVTVLSGSVYDVAVDIRVGSPTYGRWVGEELSEENGRQLWIPPGLAHGFLVLSETALFQYKVDAPYSKDDEVTIRWDDPAFGIEWPGDAPILSPRDASAPLLSGLPAGRVPRWRAPG